MGRILRHSLNTGGAGKHADKRNRRRRTRGAAKREAVNRNREENRA